MEGSQARFFNGIDQEPSGGISGSFFLNLGELPNEPRMFFKGLPS